MRITGLDIDEFFLNFSLNENGEHFIEKSGSIPTDINKVLFAFKINDFDEVICGDFECVRTGKELKIKPSNKHIEGDILFLIGTFEDMQYEISMKPDNDVVDMYIMEILYTDGVNESPAYMVIKIKANNESSRKQILNLL